MGSAVSRPTTKRIQILRNIKVAKLNQKLGGHFGQVRRLLHPGGRVTNGMSDITTTYETW